MQNSDSRGGAVAQYRERLLQAVADVNEGEVTLMASELIEARQRSATIFLAGNGGSSSTVNHYAIDWMLGTEVGNPPFRVISMSESVASVSATGNDKGFDFVFSRQLERLGEQGDLLVLVSASGNSPNLLEAAKVAKVKGIRIVSVSGFDGGRLKDLADVSVHTPTQAGDYGVAEDVHLAIGHMIKEALIEAVREK